MQVFRRFARAGRKAAVIGDNPEGIAGHQAKPETMAELKASRTLVKSNLELWAECSDAGSLARHLGAFGEIQIIRLEPETAVAWEGEDVRGTVTLEPSGWGTRVVLTAEVPTPAVGVKESARDVAVGPEADPVAVAQPGRPGFFMRLFGSWRRSADPLSENAQASLAQVTGR